MRKNGQRAFSKEKGGPKIKWSCDEETFVKKENGEDVTYNIAEYFSKIYDINLQYPNAKPMVEVLGRRKQSIFLPAELLAGNELGKILLLCLLVSRFVNCPIVKTHINYHVHS